MPVFTFVPGVEVDHVVLDTPGYIMVQLALLVVLAGLKHHASLGTSWGLVLTGGMNRERCSWPGMIRGVEARIDPAEGAPFRCLTLPCSSTLVRAWMSLRSRRSRTRVRCC